MPDRQSPVTPYEIKRKLQSWQHVLKQVELGLDGKPFSWSGGEMEAHVPKMLMIGVTLVTKTQIEKRGYRLRRGVKPVGSGYFLAPISRSADLYVLECQCTKVEELSE